MEATKKRIHFEFAPDAVERMENLKRLTGVSTYVDVVRHALRFYEFFKTKQEEGYEAKLVKSDDEETETISVLF